MSANKTTPNWTRTTEDDYGFRETKIVLYFFILTCSTFGNAVVVYIICSYKKMRTPSNFLILNLAVSDLLTPLVSIPFDFALEENGYTWMYGAFVCKLLWPCQTFFSTISSLTLAGIALDRYRILMHPFTTRLTRKQIGLMLLAIYLFCGIAMIPYVHFLRLTNNECGEQWPAASYRKSFTVFLFLIQYALPLVFMIVMYSLAVRNLCKARDKMRSSSVNSSEKNQNHANLSSVRGRIATLSRRMTLNSWDNPNAKATKMFIIVVAVFAIFMLPNQAVWLWAEFGGGQDKPIFSKLSIVCWLFTYTNSVVNPVIFRNFSKDFRSGFKVVLGQVCDCACFRSVSQVERARRYLEGNVSTNLTSSAAESSGQSEFYSETANGKIARRNIHCDTELKTCTKWLNGSTLLQPNETTPFVKKSSSSTIPHTGKESIDDTCQFTRLENCKKLMAIDALGKERSERGHLWFENENILSCIESSPETCC